jgi:hypothetical protein
MNIKKDLDAGLEFMTMQQLFSKLPASYQDGSRILHESESTISSLTLIDRIIRDHMDIFRADPSVLWNKEAKNEIDDFVRVITRIESSGEEYGCPLFAINSTELVAAIEKIRAATDVIMDSYLDAGVIEARTGVSQLCINVVYNVMHIHRGFVEQVRTEIISAPPVFDVLFLKVSGIRETIERDIHDFVGWHYHYCNHKGERSDTMLSFDALSEQSDKPLFWEKHSENNAKFQARAAAWKRRKRQSVYEACRPELKRPAREFRRPEKTAQPVWPTGAILSPLTQK